MPGGGLVSLIEGRSWARGDGGRSRGDRRGGRRCARWGPERQGCSGSGWRWDATAADRGDRHGAPASLRRRRRWPSVEYRRLSRHCDAQLARPRLCDTVQTVCQSWLLAREQKLQPNALYNYAWVLSLIYPHVGRVRASRLSARMAERTYRDLEAAGYSRSRVRDKAAKSHHGTRNLLLDPVALEIL